MTGSRSSSSSSGMIAPQTHFAGSIWAACLSAVWLICWALILRGIGVGEDWAQFSKKTAIILSGVTVFSATMAVLLAARCSARVPQRHWGRYLTCGLYLLASPTIAYFPLAMFVLWYWNVR